MEFRSLSRESSAFQQPVSDVGIQAICARCFGADVRLTSAVELGGGVYNTTYRITAEGLPEPFILGIAPAPEQQCTSDESSCGTRLKLSAGAA